MIAILPYIHTMMSIHVRYLHIVPARSVGLAARQPRQCVCARRRARRRSALTKLVSAVSSVTSGFDGHTARLSASQQFHTTVRQRGFSGVMAEIEEVRRERDATRSRSAVPGIPAGRIVSRVLACHPCCASRPQIMSRIQHHEGVCGIVIMSSKTGVCIRSTIDPDQAIKVTALFGDLLRVSQNLVKDLDRENGLTMLRLRSKKNEILVVPEADFTLVVLQNPNVNDA